MLMTKQLQKKKKKIDSIIGTKRGRKRYLRCKQCGVKDKTVVTMNEPYSEDLYGKKIRIKLCAKCAKENAAEL